MGTIDRSRKKLTYNTYIYPQITGSFAKKALEVESEEDLIKLFCDRMATQIKSYIGDIMRNVKKQGWEIESTRFNIPGNSYYGQMIINYWESEAAWSKRIKLAESYQKAAKTKKLNEQKKDLETLKKLLVKHEIKSIEDVDVKLKRQGQLVLEIQEGQVS